MRFRLVLCAFIASFGFLSSPALSQPRPREPIDGERFKPAVTHDGFVTQEGSAVRSTSDPWEFGLYLNYAFNSLVVVNENDEVADKFIAGRMGADIVASVTVAGPFAVGVDLPFFLAQTGDSAQLDGEATASEPDFAGLGDLRIVPKLRILDDRDVIGLGVVGELRAPTHAGDFSGGARNVVFVPRLVLDHRFGATGFRAGASAGVSLREGTVFENVDALSEYVYSGAVSYRIGGWDGIAALGAEAYGGVGLTDVSYEELPLELLLFSKINPTEEWEVVFGPGAGLVPGYGIPTFRAFAGVHYRPTAHDRDHDGIPDDEDACPDDPEDRDGFEDSDGCPEENDLADDDGDGIPNIYDKCPNEKETINGIDDDDGCPDGGPAKVIRKDNKLVILENVEFDTGSATISGKSYSILDQVALMMKANPDIKRVRIEGHTDSRGSHSMNMFLSQSRAESVRQYLVRKGVGADRLTSKGFGPDRPLVEETDDASLQKNRRVEFIIEEEDSPSPAKAPGAK